MHKTVRYIAGVIQLSNEESYLIVWLSPGVYFDCHIESRELSMWYKGGPAIPDICLEDLQ